MSMSEAIPETEKEGQTKLPAVVDSSLSRLLPHASESGGGAEKIPVRTTVPDELLRHDISDEELEMLGDNRRGFFHEMMWACITGALGAAWGAIDAIHSAYIAQVSHPLSGYELWEVIVLFVFIVLAGFSGFMVHNEGHHRGDALKEKIRNRTKSRVGTLED